MFLIIKSIHIGCAILSITGFTARVMLRFSMPDSLKLRWVRILPHVIDTLLLVSAITMLIMTSQYPTGSDWISVKLYALCAYILLGILSLRLGKTRIQILTAFIGALLCYTYIVSVALTKTVWPF